MRYVLLLGFACFSLLAQTEYDPRILSDQMDAIDREASNVLVYQSKDGYTIDFSGFSETSEFGQGYFEFFYQDKNVEIIISEIDSKSVEGKVWHITNKEINSVLSRSGVKATESNAAAATFPWGFGWLAYNDARYLNPNEPGDGLAITIRSKLYCIETNCIMFDSYAWSEIGDNILVNQCDNCKNVSSFNYEVKDIEETGYVTRARVHADKIETSNYDTNFGIGYVRVF